MPLDCTVTAFVRCENCERKTPDATWIGLESGPKALQLAALEAKADRWLCIEGDPRDEWYCPTCAAEKSKVPA